MRMLRQEDVARVPDFAGQRVRLASVVVEMVNRTPSRMLHRTFSILDIGTDGLLDVARLNTRQIARMDDPLAPARPAPVNRTPIVDAAALHRSRRVLGARRSLLRSGHPARVAR